MLKDVWTFTRRVFAHWLAWFGLMSAALRAWAELQNDPSRTFIGNPALWSWLAAAFFVMACFQAWREAHREAENLRPMAPKFALVGADGSILHQRNFSEFGLVAGLWKQRIGERDYPVYRLKFEREPDYFEIRTNDGATPRVKRAQRAAEFEVEFVSPGFGAPHIAVNFRIKAY